MVSSVKHRVSLALFSSSFRYSFSYTDVDVDLSMSLLATLLVCSLLWCGVRTATKPDIEALFVDTGLDDKTFSEHLLFDYPAKHALGCARQCLHHALCLAFTFDLGTCQGHSEVKTSASASTSATGAKCFAKVTAGR